MENHAIPCMSSDNVAIPTMYSVHCIPWKTMQCHVCLMAMVEYQLGDRASQLGFRRQFTFPGSYWRAGGWEQISRTLPVSPKYWRPKIINVNCPRPNVCAIVTCNIVTKGGIWWLGKRKGKRWLVRVVVRCDDVRADVRRCNKFCKLCNIHLPGPLAVTSLTDVYMINVKVFMQTLKSWRGAVLVQMWFHWVR